MNTKEEPILQEDPRKFSLFPIRYPDVWQCYKQLVSTFWVAEEVDIEADKLQFETKLSQQEKHYICTILAFFASSDCIVGVNLVKFMDTVKMPEAQCFLGFQLMQENIHAEVYALMIDRLCDANEHVTLSGRMEGSVFVTDTTLNSDSAAITYAVNGVKGEAYTVDNGLRLSNAPTIEGSFELSATVSRKDHLFQSLTTMPAIKKKGEWCIQWMDEELPYAERLVAWAVVEGLLFASSFASIAYFKNKGLLPGVGTVNEWISRDESNHANFACLLLKNYIKNRPSVDTVHTIFQEAIAIEDEFVQTSLPCALVGICCEDMQTYIRYCANRLLEAMGYPILYPGAKSPWRWINLLSVNGMTSFFEKRVADYSKSTLKKCTINFEATEF